MYFRESDSIASSNYEFTDEIEQLDGLLYQNQGQPVRVVRTAAMLDFDDEQAEDLLGLFEHEGVVTRTELLICPKCDDIVERTGTSVECDLCERSFSDSEWQVETGFIARRTTFEAGDELRNGRQYSDYIDDVFPIVGCDNEDRVADIVFLHGLDGDATATWHPSGKPEKYWPRWLGEDLPHVGIWSVDYEAKKFKWSGDALPLEDRATNCLEKLVASGIGQRPLMFVTHSLGGLVAKQVLRHAATMGMEDWEPISQSCRGVVFIATPHAGSNLANYVKYLTLVLRPTKAVDDLEAKSAPLRNLNDWYRNNSGKLNIGTKAFYETKQTNGFHVVDAVSAEPGLPGVKTVPIEENHIDICKPDSRSSMVYVTCKQFCERILHNATS